MPTNPHNITVALDFIKENQAKYAEGDPLRAQDIGEWKYEHYFNDNSKPLTWHRYYGNHMVIGADEAELGDYQAACFVLGEWLRANNERYGVAKSKLDNDWYITDAWGNHKTLDCDDDTLSALLAACKELVK